MIKLKISGQVSRRLRELPNITRTTVQKLTEKQADDFISLFKRSIEHDELGLEGLQPATVVNKARKGYTRPLSPLYGKGRQDKRSYINMLQKVKTANGYSVRVKPGKHHSGLTFRKIFQIHEFGTVINRNGSVIVIPPRPALNMTFRRWLDKKKNKSTSQQMKRVISQYIRTGRKPNV